MTLILIVAAVASLTGFIGGTVYADRKRKPVEPETQYLGSGA